MNDDFLRSSLEREAADHQPDRTAMLNRIAAGRAGVSRRKRAVRMALSAAAVVVVLVSGGVARWALTAAAPSPPLPPSAVASSPPSAASSPISGSPTSGSPTSGSPTSGSPTSGSPTSGLPSSASISSGVVRGHPGDTKVEKGTLWSDGSVEPATSATSGRSDVTLKASSPLSALDLTIRVALTDGVVSRGTDSVDGVTATVTHTSGALIYHFVLRPGASLPAGTYVFVAEYAHSRGGRDAGQDTYEAYATDGLHKKPHVYGNFYPTK